MDEDTKNSESKSGVTLKKQHKYALNIPTNSLLLWRKNLYSQNLCFLFCLWLEDSTVGAEAERLYQEAREMLNTIIKKRQLTARGILGFYPANSVGGILQANFIFWLKHGAVAVPVPVPYLWYGTKTCLPLNLFYEWHAL